MAPTDWIPIYNIFVFLAWTATSFLCHFCGKAFLVEISESLQTTVTDVWQNVLSAGILTVMQLGLCYVCVGVQAGKDAESLQTARLTHAVATFLTNVSLSFMFASSTLAIKLMEPITSAVTQFCLLRTPMSPVTILSLPAIVGGAIMFTGSSFSDSSLWLGIAAAFISNIVLAIRNLAIKKISNGDLSPLNLTFQTAHLVRLLPVVLAGSILVYILGKASVLHGLVPYVFSLCFLSGVFHVAYSYVSTCLVLSQLSVVSHAVANILKRVLVVLMLYLAGKRVATLDNFLGLGVCILGLFLYTWDRQARCSVSRGTLTEWLKRPNKLPWSYLVVTPCCLLLFCGTVQIFPRMLRLQDKTAVSVLRRLLDAKQPLVFNTEQEKKDKQNTLDPLFDLAFGPNALKLPETWQLEPNLEAFSGKERKKIQQFLQTNLIEDLENANYLLTKLNSTVAVIKETQRIHYNILVHVIGKYKYCMLFDIADIENNGDPAITVGEVYFLARLGIEIVYYCSSFVCTQSTINRALEVARKYSPDELVILLHRGGDTNAYFWHDELRADIFQKFRGFKFVIFPQSIPLGNVATEHFQKCIQTYCCNENLTFIFRDYQLYYNATKYFNGTSRLIVAPDMAFHIGPVKRFMSPVFDILWIKRSDGESPGYFTVPSYPPHLRVHISDWFKFYPPKAGSSLERSFYATVMDLFFVQRGRVVITDRIHGHILCILLDIPHVLLDNKVRTLSSYHKSWTLGLAKTRLAYSPTEAMAMAIELLDIYGKRHLSPRAPWLNVSEYFRTINYSVPEVDLP